MSFHFAISFLSRRAWIACAGLFVLINLIGCTDIYRNDNVFILDPGQHNATKATAARLFFRDDFYQMNPYTFAGVDGTNNWENESLFSVAHNPKRSDDQRKEARNMLMGAMLMVSDIDTAGHLSRVTGTQINSNIFIGGANLAATGAAAVTTGGTAQALAAAATGLGGFRSLFNEQVYQKALVQSLVSLVVSHRQKARLGFEGAFAKSISDYSVEAAIADAEAYHETGSFYYGLALLQEAAQKKTQDLSVEQNQKNDADAANTVAKAQATAEQTKQAAIKEQINTLNLQRQLNSTTKP